jgi:hypothetical protein
MKLGSVVSHVRHGRSYVDKRADLESIGFNFNPQSLNRRYELGKVALQTYKDLNGDMLVPAIFVVPTNDITWPIETWGMKLGSVVNSIRAGNSHVNKRADLENMGFDYSPQESGKEFPSERECRRIFEEIFEETFVKIRPEWLISSKTFEPLELDGYNEKLKTAFEYQGEHHEKLSYYNDFSEEKLFEQQERDRDKVRICADRGITLIVIPSKYNYEDPLALKNFILSELWKFKDLRYMFKYMLKTYVEV